MAGPQIVVEMDANEAKMWQAFKKLEKAEGDAEKGLKRIKQATGEVSKENRKLERDAKRLYESTRTPQERYNRGLAEAKRHLDANRISAQTYSRRIDQLTREYRESTRQTKRLDTAQRETFGGAGLATITRYAAQIGGIAVAISKAIELLGNLEQQSAEAFQRLKGGRVGLGELAQLATTEAEQKTLVAAARSAYAGGVGGSVDEAAATIFALKSAGQFENRQIFLDLASKGVIRGPQTLVKAVSQIQGAMGVEETGVARDVVSKLFAASAATQYTVPEIAEAAARPGVLGGGLGLRDEEVMAATAVVSQAMPAAEAGTAVRAFLKTLMEKDQFQGMPLAETIAEVERQTSGLTGEDRQKWFGRIEGMVGFDVLARQRDAFSSLLGQIDEAQATDLVGGRLKLPDIDTASRQARLAEKAARSREVTEETGGLGAGRALFERILEFRRGRAISEGRYLSAAAINAEMRSRLWATGLEESLGYYSQSTQLPPDIRGDLRKAGAPDPRPGGLMEATAKDIMYDWWSRDIERVDVSRLGGSRGADPQMEENNALLRDISQKLERGDANNTRAIPVNTSSANRVNRE